MEMRRLSLGGNPEKAQGNGCRLVVMLSDPHGRNLEVVSMSNALFRGGPVSRIQQHNQIFGTSECSISKSLMTMWDGWCAVYRALMHSKCSGVARSCVLSPSSDVYRWL